MSLNEFFYSFPWQNDLAILFIILPILNQYTLSIQYYLFN